MKKVVVIAEKPNTANKISHAIGKQPGVLVVPARGHIVEINYPEHMRGGKWFYPVIEMPSDLVYEPLDSASDVLSRIAAACKDCTTLVSATDLDREGSAIFMEILFYLQEKFGKKFQPELKRMCYSSLVPGELKNAYDNLQPFDDGRSYAGLTRNIQDMQWGINLTRGLTLAAQNFSSGRDILSSGRVQTPMLKLIHGRDCEIDNFKPKEYYQLKAIFKTDAGESFEALYQGKITSVEQVMAIAGDIQIGGRYKVDVADTKQRTPPPPPFNGTALQVEGNRVLGFSAKLIANRQNGLAQVLYQAGLISYPGTDSEKYPKDWTDESYKKFRELLFKILGNDTDKIMTRKSFVVGKKTDEAHPCIRPVLAGLSDRSGDDGGVNPDAWKLFELIARRCAAGACGDAIVKVKNILVKIDNTGDKSKPHVFKATGKTYEDKGFLEVYHYNIKDDKLVPDLNSQDEVIASKTTHEKKLTKPPPRYNTVSLIAQCDKLGLGTKNTRPSMVEKLQARGFVEVRRHGKKEVLITTELADRVITTLDKYAPVITSKELTEKFNLLMERIEKEPGKFDKLNVEMLDELLMIMDKIKLDEAEIGAGITGSELDGSVKCAKCGKVMKNIITQDKDRVNFFGCSGYPDCDHKLFYHTGEVVRFGVTCRSCGSPCASGILTDKGPEYVRCLGDCAESPMRCAKCGKKIFVGRSKKASKKLYSLCRDCGLFNKFKVDFDRVVISDEDEGDDNDG